MQMRSFQWRLVWILSQPGFLAEFSLFIHMYKKDLHHDNRFWLNFRISATSLFNDNIENMPFQIDILQVRCECQTIFCTSTILLESTQSTTIVRFQRASVWHQCIQFLYLNLARRMGYLPQYFMNFLWHFKVRIKTVHFVPMLQWWCSYPVAIRYNLYITNSYYICRMFSLCLISGIFFSK